jgi:glycosyltransferase involved in cell wall biosynthesis
MSCCRPIIAIDKCGSAVDLIDNDLNGFIFKSGDQQDLVLKLKTMAGKTKEELKEMGRNSGNKIMDFSYERCCKAIESLILNIRAKKSKRSGLVKFLI